MKHHYGACQGGPSCNCDDYDSEEETPQNEIEITKDSNDACERIENVEDHRS